MRCDEKSVFQHSYIGYFVELAYKIGKHIVKVRFSDFLTVHLLSWSKAISFERKHLKLCTEYRYIIETNLKILIYYIWRVERVIILFCYFICNSSNFILVFNIFVTFTILILST